MSGLHGSVGDYLSVRRALGFQLVDAGRLLVQFADFAETAGADTITTDWRCSGPLCQRNVWLPGMGSGSRRCAASPAGCRPVMRVAAEDQRCHATDLSLRSRLIATVGSGVCRSACPELSKGGADFRPDRDGQGGSPESGLML